MLKTDYGQEEAIAVFGHDPRIYQTTVKEFLKDKNGNLCGLVTVKLEPKRDEKTGRVTMTEVAGSEQKMEADLVLDRCRIPRHGKICGGRVRCGLKRQNQRRNGGGRL